MRRKNDPYQRLRAAQARRVMPLIGPLLDAWDGLSNDQRDYTDGFRAHMEAIHGAVEDDASQPRARRQGGRKNG